MLYSFWAIVLIFGGLRTAVSQSQDPPIITLPWGKYKADSYDKTGDFWIFKNVRFGESPTGDLRFAKSIFPKDKSSDLQDTSYGPSCYQIRADVKDPAQPKAGVGHGTVFQVAQEQQWAEDCLFLDLYVPASSFREGNTEKLPAVIWFYGGGFILGSKSTPGPFSILYNATGLMRTAVRNQKKFIFVVGNYRSGAFGWLAGPTVEKDKLSTPNAGLWDQRLLLEWVQNHISDVGGDPKRVSAWGSSAGAGSIIHHLTQFGGTKDPLFQSAILISPAFQWMRDRSPSGRLQQAFNTFADNAKCPDHSMKCLREASVDDLQAANQEIFETYHTNNIFPFGPSVDGGWIKDLPILEFNRGNFYKGLKTIIVSNCYHEADMFVPDVKDEAGFNRFISKMFDRASITDAVTSSKFYKKSWFESPTKRLLHVTRDAVFLANTRAIYNAYSAINSSSVYAMSYRFPLPGFAHHGLEQLPLYLNDDLDTKEVIENFPGLEGKNKERTKLLREHLKDFSHQYQPYFVASATTGDPNAFNSPESVTWQKAKDDKKGAFANSLIAEMGFNRFFTSGRDDFNTQDRYKFWLEAAGILASGKHADAGDEGNPRDEL